MILVAILASIALQKPVAVPDDAALGEALRALPAARAVLEKADEHRVQVLLATIETDTKDRPILARRGLRVDREYFYPASAIKLCAAIATLEELDARRVKEPRLGEDVPIVFHPLFAGEEIEQKDPTHLADGTITLRQEIKKLFLVSDNAAFNRLYEFVGQDRLAEHLERAGFSTARIVHRLSEARTEDENRRVPRVDFVFADETRATIPERTSRLSIQDLRLPGIKVGTASVDGKKRVEAPMSFARKNAIALVELQEALAKLVRPDLVLDGEPYAITDEQRTFLLATATAYPADSRDPRYPREQYPDAEYKFLLPGLERVAPKSAWKIANKIGRAYGFSIENAWVVHVPSGRGMFVTATLYTNADGVLNDGVYEYETIADPFFTALGEVVGRELAR